MSHRIYEFKDVRVLEYANNGSLIRTRQQAMDLIAAARDQHAALVIIPVECLDEGFFQLRTGIAGEILQKFVTYGLRLAILGDISRHLEESRSFRDLVRETNRGSQCWFVMSLEDLAPPLLLNLDARR